MQKWTVAKIFGFSLLAPGVVFTSAVAHAVYDRNLVSDCKQVYATSGGARSSDFLEFSLKVDSESLKRNAEDKGSKPEFYLKGMANDFTSEALVTLTRRKGSMTLLGMGDDDEMYWSRRSENPGDAFPGYYFIEIDAAGRANIDNFYLPYGKYDSDEMPQKREGMLLILNNEARLLASLKNCKVDRSLLRKIRGSRFD